MKKKLLIVMVLVAVLVPATLSAKMFDLSLGPSVQFKPDLGQLTDDSADLGELFTSLDSYAFGADLRLKILLAQVDVAATFGQHVDASDNKYTEISVLTTGGVSFDLFGFTRLGIGLGPRFRVLFGDDGASVLNENRNVETWENLGDAFIKSPLALRATADFKIGKMWLGVNYSLDTKYTFEKYDEFDKLFSPNWDEGRFGVSLLFSFF